MKLCRKPVKIVYNNTNEVLFGIEKASLEYQKPPLEKKRKLYVKWSEIMFKSHIHFFFVITKDTYIFFLPFLIHLYSYVV